MGKRIKVKYMGIDIEAIKRKMAELNGEKRQSSIQQWKPQLGEHKIRVLPWPDAKDGEPFHDRQFYYIEGSQGFLAPSQFGKPDPINELLRKLYSSGKAEDRLTAKKLLPKTRSYAPIIVRGEEDKGVQIWAFGKTVHQRLLSFFLDDEVGDFTDIEDGLDLKITISKVQGKDFNDTSVDPARKSSKLSSDQNEAQKWIDNIPNLNDMYKEKSYHEIESLLNNWINGGTSNDMTEGTQKSGGSDVTEKMVDDLKQSVKKEPVAQSEKVTKKQKKQTDDEDLSPATGQSLDDVFNDLMAEEN